MLASLTSNRPEPGAGEVLGDWTLTSGRIKMQIVRAEFRSNASLPAYAKLVPLLAPAELLCNSLRVRLAGLWQALLNHENDHPLRNTSSHLDLLNLLQLQPLRHHDPDFEEAVIWRICCGGNE